MTSSAFRIACVGGPPAILALGEPLASALDLLRVVGERGIAPSEHGCPRWPQHVRELGQRGIGVLIDPAEGPTSAPRYRLAVQVTRLVEERVR